MIHRAVFLVAAGCAAAGAIAASAPAEAQSLRQIASQTGCKDPNGQNVVAISHSGLSNVGMAGRVRGRAVILINPMILRQFRPATRIFWYYHECAHHALGHSLGYQPMSRERDADCWAIRQMRRRGLLTAARLRTIQQDLYPLGGDGRLYLPGPQRAAYVGYCATGRRAPLRMARRRAAPPDGYRPGPEVVDDGRLAGRYYDEVPTEGPVPRSWRSPTRLRGPSGSGIR